MCRRPEISFSLGHLASLFGPNNEMYRHLLSDQKKILSENQTNPTYFKNSE